MKNRTCRKLLEQRYGKGCFMERAGIRKITLEEEQELKKIKGYKKFNRQITYYHIKQKSLGGEVSISNGANLAAYNHEWLHQQPPEVIDEINQKLQDFKLSIDMGCLSITDNGVKMDNTMSVEFDMEDCISIPVYDNTIEDDIKRHKKFNRAKIKQETRKIIDDELDR